jgi:hypothetical protein
MAYYLVNKQNPEYCLNMNKYTGSDLEKIKTDYSMDGYLYFNKFTPTEQAKNCTAFTLPSTTNHEGVWMIKGADGQYYVATQKDADAIDRNIGYSSTLKDQKYILLPNGAIQHVGSKRCFIPSGGSIDTSSTFQTFVTTPDCTGDTFKGAVQKKDIPAQPGTSIIEKAKKFYEENKKIVWILLAAIVGLFVYFKFIKKKQQSEDNNDDEDNNSDTDKKKKSDEGKSKKKSKKSDDDEDDDEEESKGKSKKEKSKKSSSDDEDEDDEEEEDSGKESKKFRSKSGRDRSKEKEKER